MIGTWNVWTSWSKLFLCVFLVVVFGDMGASLVHGSREQLQVALKSEAKTIKNSSRSKRSPANCYLKLHENKF